MIFTNFPEVGYVSFLEGILEAPNRFANPLEIYRGPRRKGNRMRFWITQLFGISSPGIEEMTNQKKICGSWFSDVFIWWKTATHLKHMRANEVFPKGRCVYFLLILIYILSFKCTSWEMPLKCPYQNISLNLYVVITWLACFRKSSRPTQNNLHIEMASNLLPSPSQTNIALKMNGWNTLEY